LRDRSGRTPDEAEISEISARHLIDTPLKPDKIEPYNAMGFIAEWP
jgi:hypothetical protein